jgi:aspartate racemase
MAKHIGIVGCSAEGAALCYRTICCEAPKLMGEWMHPRITMDTICLGEYERYIGGGDWEAVGDLMLKSTKILAAAGADFAICPDNTIHRAFDYVVDKSPIPWLHIAQVVAQAAKRAGYRKLGILGTKFLMTGPVYYNTLARFNIEHQIPGEAERQRINAIIWKELVNAEFKEESRLWLNEVIGRLKIEGCDAVVLGCTEIPLLVDPDNCPLPVLDSTRLLARAAVRNAVA